MSKRFVFIIAAIVLFAVGIGLRATSARSARTQADAIVAADAAGKPTAALLSSLSDFVKQHMGASVALTLKGSYDRAVVAAGVAAAAANPSTQVYADAQKACSGKTDSITQARCNQAYLAAHLTATPPPVSVPAPQLGSYQHTYAAPLWTPDLAGAVLLGATVAGVLGLIGNRRKGRH